LSSLEIKRLGVRKALETGPHLLRWSTEELEDLLPWCPVRVRKKNTKEKMGKTHLVDLVDFASSG
jgi:hypothetical protein